MTESFVREATVRVTGQPKPILDRISITFAQPGVHVICGPSGSGKSTLLALLGGFIAPESGEVHVLGRDLRSLPERETARLRLRRLGFVFQNFGLFASLSALDNVILPLQMRGIAPVEARARGRDQLEAVDLGDRAHELPGGLSGGERQRVAIARALAGDPELVLADEPTASLDTTASQTVLELLRGAAGRRSIVLVTHDERLGDVADRFTVLTDGRIRDES